MSAAANIAIAVSRFAFRLSGPGLPQIVIRPPMSHTRLAGNTALAMVEVTCPLKRQSMIVVRYERSSCEKSSRERQRAVYLHRRCDEQPKFWFRDVVFVRNVTLPERPIASRVRFGEIARRRWVRVLNLGHISGRRPIRSRRCVRSILCSAQGK